MNCCCPPIGQFYTILETGLKGHNQHLLTEFSDSRPNSIRVMGKNRQDFRHLTPNYVDRLFILDK